MSINERVQKIIDDLYSGNQRAFSGAIGVTASVIGNIVGKRQSSPSFELIEKIIYSIEDISIEWLLTGRGEMLRKISSANVIDSDMVSEDQAGYGNALSDNTKPFISSFKTSEFIPDFFNSIIEGNCKRIAVPFVPDYDFSILYHGDSMVNKVNPHRSIGDKDLVACKLWRDRSYILWGEVYVLVTKERVIIRKVVQSERAGNIKCIAFNEQNGYEPFDLPIANILDMAIVVGVSTTSVW